MYQKKEAHFVSFREELEWKGEIAELKSLIKSLNHGGQQTRACGIYTDESRPTNMFPQLQDTTAAKVHAARGFGPHMPIFEGDNKYNSRRNDHPGFRWSDPPGVAQLHIMRWCA